MRTVPLRTSAFLLIAAAAGLPNLTAMAHNGRPGTSGTKFSGVIAAIEYSGQLDLLTIKDDRLISKAVHQEPAFGSVGFYRGLAISRDGKSVFLLIPRGRPTSEVHTDEPFTSHGELLMMDAQTLQVRPLMALPDGREYSFLAVGQATGNLWLFASDGDSVLEIDPDRATTIAAYDITKDANYSWGLVDVALSNDEQRIYLSYHGGCRPGLPPHCTSGIDWYDRNAGTLVRCGVHPIANGSVGCIVSHGQFVLLPDRVLAATGHEVIHSLDLSGHVLTDYHSQLGGHVMSVAVTPDASRIVVAAPCPAGGLRVLAARDPKTPALAWSDQVCGDRIAVTNDGKWAVVTGSRALTAYSHDVLVASLLSGSVVVRVTLPGDVAEALPIPANPH